jgi:hypothetical protein
MLAPSAFLASAAGSSSISSMILPDRCLIEDYTLQQEALEIWQASNPEDPPSGPKATQQKAWDTPVIAGVFSSLLHEASPKCRARLLAAQKKESGAWLNAPSISSLGLRMEDTVITTAVGLRLGSPLCLEHICQHCGQDVDVSGTHGLSCRRSQGRIPRHSALNDVIKRSLAAINIPATLEPKGLCRGDGRRPDGVTIIPWKSGRALVWDVTCHDTFAPSNIPLSCSSAGRVANEAAKNKCRTYADLRQSHHFIPLAMETMGVFGEDTHAFLIEIARRL